MITTKILFGFLIGVFIFAATAAAERPTVILTFDDGWLSVSERAYPIMHNNHQKGVAFVNIEPIIGGYTDYMKQPELNTLYGEGWDISSHTYSHKILNTINNATLNYELGAGKGWLDTNGYPRGSMFLSYPEGSYNPDVIAAAKSNHYLAARTIKETAAGYPHYTLASPDVFELTTYETIGGRDNDTTVINQINNTIAANGLLILSFHKIVDSLSSGTARETEFKTSDFQNVSNYLRIRSLDVDVRTLSDYFGVPTPVTVKAMNMLYMPSTPEMTKQTSGYFWTYFEWGSGTGGNITDFYNYNVDGVWTNLTTNTSVTVATIPHGKVSVTVYAFNRSNGGIQNPVPLMMSTQIPNNPIEMSNIWAEYDIYSGDTLRIAPTLYNPDIDTVTFTTNATSASINSTTGEFILNTSDRDRGTYHWNITADDGHGMPHTIDFTVVITARQSLPAYNNGRGDGNKGGSVGINVYDPNAESNERSDSIIRRGIESKIVFTRNKLISNVTYHGKRNYGEVTVKASILKGNPTGSYMGNVYKFFSITLGDIPQKNEILYISNSTVTVLVNKSDLRDNIVRAYRYVNDSWVAVKIEDAQVEDTDTKQFKLKSDGLSNFAIVLEPEKKVPTLRPTVTDGETNALNTSIDKPVTYVWQVIESLYREIIHLIRILDLLPP